MTMLDLERIDLEGLCMALEDHSAGYGDAFWLFDTRTGETQYYSRDAGDFDDADDLHEALWPVRPLPSAEGYADMADFIELVPDRGPAELLARAIQGRGAFRRFKDTLLEFPELREQWFAFRDARLRRHAIEWLADHGFIDEETAREAQTRHADPPMGGTAPMLARRVADDLRKLYGDRLVQVMVYGSRVRGDYHEESDLDLLVVLDHVDDSFEERHFMADVIWQHTLDSGITVSAQVVSRERFDRADSAFLRNVRADGLAA